METNSKEQVMNDTVDTLAKQHLWNEVYWQLIKEFIRLKR